MISEEIISQRHSIQNSGFPINKKPKQGDALGINFHKFCSKAIVTTPVGIVTIVPTKSEVINWKNKNNNILEKDELILKKFISRMKSIITSLNKLESLMFKDEYDLDHAEIIVKSLISDIRYFHLPKDDLYFQDLINIDSISGSNANKEIDFLSKLYAYWEFPENMESVSERCCGVNIHSKRYLTLLTYGWVSHEDKDKVSFIEKIRKSKGDEYWIKSSAILCHMMGSILWEYMNFLAAMFPKIRRKTKRLPLLVKINATVNCKKKDRNLSALVGQEVEGFLYLATDKEGKSYYRNQIKKNQKELPFRSKERINDRRTKKESRTKAMGDRE